MKWFYLVVILVIGGVLYYYMFREPELQTDSPQGTASAFVHAALNGDTDMVRGLCQPAAMDSAETIAQEIQASSPDPRSFKWRDTPASDPTYSGVTALFEGRVITLEMVEEAGEYRIAQIDLTR